MNNDRQRISRRALVASSIKGMISVAISTLFPLRRAVASGSSLSERWEEEARDLIRGIRPPRIPRVTTVVTGVSHAISADGSAQKILQAALDEAAKRGGGRVVVPVGEWFIKGSIQLSSHVELHIPEGAQLTFSDDPKDYLPPRFTRWEGTEVFSLSAPIFAHEATNVAITGKGTIRGNGESARKRGMTHRRVDQDKLRQMGDDRVPVSERIFGEGHILPPSCIQFVKCTSVLVEGITILDTPFWGLHVVYCEDALVRHVSVASLSLNNDGVDVDSSQRVLIDDCTFSTGDDCVAIKSGRDLDGRIVGRPSRDIVIQNCLMKLGRSAGVAIGSEMSGGVHNVYILNCRMERVDTALDIKSNLDRGGYVHGIRMGRVVIDACETVVGVTTNYHSYRGGRAVPVIRDISLADVWCQRAHRAVSILGHHESPVELFAAHSLRIGKTEVPLVAENAKNIVFENVLMNGSSVVAQREYGSAAEAQR